MADEGAKKGGIEEEWALLAAAARLLATAATLHDSPLRRRREVLADVERSIEAALLSDPLARPQSEPVPGGRREDPGDLEASVEGTADRESSADDPTVIRRDLALTYQELLEELRSAQHRRMEDELQSPLQFLRRSLGPISLALGAAAIGGALGAGGAVWPMAALLVAIGTVLAWLSKIEHDRRHADLLTSAQAASREAGISLDRLQAALDG